MRRVACGSESEPVWELLHVVCLFLDQTLATLCAWELATRLLAALPRTQCPSTHYGDICKRSVRIVIAAVKSGAKVDEPKRRRATGRRKKQVLGGVVELLHLDLIIWLRRDLDARWSIQTLGSSFGSLVVEYLSRSPTELAELKVGLHL